MIMMKKLNFEVNYYRINYPLVGTMYGPIGNFHHHYHNHHHHHHHHYHHYFDFFISQIYNPISLYTKYDFSYLNKLVFILGTAYFPVMSYHLVSLTKDHLKEHLIYLSNLNQASNSDKNHYT